MGNPLFARKPMSMLLAEAQDEGGHSLKRTARSLSTDGIGSRRDHWRGHLCAFRSGCALCRTGPDAFFVLSGLGCAFAGLCYAEFAAMIRWLAARIHFLRHAGELFAWIIGWDLTLEYAMGASTVSNRLVQPLHRVLNIFKIKMPLWLAYDHWTG